MSNTRNGVSTLVHLTPLPKRGGVGLIVSTPRTSMAIISFKVIPFGAHHLVVGPQGLPICVPYLCSSFGSKLVVRSQRDYFGKGLHVLFPQKNYYMQMNF